MVIFMTFFMKESKNQTSVRMEMKIFSFPSIKYNQKGIKISEIFYLFDVDISIMNNGINRSLYLI